jgi:ubiquitin-like-conjugating enzyme ATG10
MKEHPATNKPVFFIHPCQTAEAMEAIAGNRRLTANEYLLLWLGAFGKCVGLDVPLALARELDSRELDLSEQNMD